MTRYEYIRGRFDFADLSEMNRLAGQGWRVVSVVQVDYETDTPYCALMEREQTEAASPPVAGTSQKED